MGKWGSYTEAVKAKLADLFLVRQTNNGDTDTYSVTTEQIGETVNGEQTYSDLISTDKTIVGAINEIGSLPDSAQGTIASFATSLEKPLVSCECDIVATGGGGTPTTPIPIVGYTGMTITRNDGQNPPVEEDTYSVSWQSECGTVYGGSLNVTTGVLTVDYYAVDMGLLTYGQFDTNRINVTKDNINLVTDKNPIRNNTAPYKCEVFDCSDSSVFQNTANQIRFTTTVASTDAQTTFNGKLLIYPLATPQTYQLTPTEIETLIGTNNVFCDTNGNTSVTYLETIKEYIDKRVNP